MDNPEKPNVGSGIGLVGAILVEFIVGLILILRVETKLPLDVVPLFFIHLPLWLLLGAWFRKLMGSINPSEQNFAKNNINDSTLVRGAILSWFILGLIWLLLVWFPSFKLGDYGIQLNLQSAPILLWAGVAFLMSYHGAVTMQIPRAAWSQIQKTIGFEDSDLKGNAKFRWSTFLQGLAGLLGKGG